LETAIRYKDEMQRLFADREAAGQPPPDIYPHPDDVIIDPASGEVTIDGPLSAEQAGAQEALMSAAVKSILRYFEVESALADDPANSELRKELKELKKYKDFVENSAERRARLEALRQSREALKAKTRTAKAAKRKDED
jgi:hypothetical protein